jgi:hypothetical protein
MAGCNPYDPATARQTCAGMLLPDGPTANPYDPTPPVGPLSPEVLAAWGAPVFETLGPRIEDELPPLTVGPVPLASWSAWTDGHAADVQPVPEPSTAILLATALLLAGWRRR